MSEQKSNNSQKKRTVKKIVKPGLEKPIIKTPLKIKAEFLTKKFELMKVKDSKAKVSSLAGRKTENDEDFWALRNVSFEMHEGECVGVIGLNGAGKSTLSNIISHQLHQTTGEIEIHGDVSIIAANAGMQGNLTGRENIHLKGLMMGMTNPEIEDKMQDIIDFSELGEFIDQPVKTYSSGMKAKLGFSIMVHQDPDIMIIDEGLSTGDLTFVEKAKKKMFEFREKGKTILLVSHNMADIKSWCDRVIWLNYGKVQAMGTPAEIVPQYEQFVKKFKSLNKAGQEKYKAEHRQEQFDYSVEQLEDEIAQETGLRNATIDRRLTKARDSHKLSIASKVALAFCIVLTLWIAMLSLSGVSFTDSLRNPARVFNPNAGKIKQPIKVAKNAKVVTPTSKKIVKKVVKTKASQQKTTDYTVQAGDSFSSIADANNTTVAAIQAANPNVDPASLYVGQVLKIPVSTTASSSSQNGGQ